MLQSEHAMTASILQEQIARINNAAANLSESLLHGEQLPDAILETKAEASRLTLIDTCQELLEHITRPEDFLKFTIPIVSNGEV